MVYEKVYEELKGECRKQLINGEIKGIQASILAIKLNMDRPNVVRALKKLLDMKMVYKINGRPVLYYVDSSVIIYELNTEKENHTLSSNIDDFLLERTKKLTYKGFYEQEIRDKLIDEVENYIKDYFGVIETKGKISKRNKKLEGVKYIIGVDGGGAKTHAVAYTLNGEEIAYGHSGFGNIVVNQEEGLKNIEIAILQCMRDLRVNDCVHIYAGLAGAYTGNNKNVVEKYLLSRFSVSITVISDADLVFASLLKGEDGILTISDTGSISFGIHNNKYIRAGGWGNILGDEGSGYHIVLKALKLIVAEKDNGESPSYLSREVMRAINVSSIADLVKFVHITNKVDIAALVPVIVSAAGKNDNNAITILDQAGKDIADITVKVYRQLEFKEKVKIAISGNILAEIPFIKERFMKYISEEINDFVIIDENVSRVKGAYYIYKQLSNNHLK